MGKQMNENPITGKDFQFYWWNILNASYVQ